MTRQEVRSPGSSGRGRRERSRVITLAGLIVGGIGLYLAFGAAGRSGSSATLLPYQTLVRTLPDFEGAVFRAIRAGLLDVEAERSRLGRWPEASALTASHVDVLDGERGYTWQRFQDGALVNYFGLARDPSRPAWLLAVQEPEPGAPPDPSPLDDEHHQLPDGTKLHIYIWTHRYGGRLAPGLVRQPQSDGWTQVFASPPNPVVPPRS